jgi:uncharacterized membrane protein
LAKSVKATGFIPRGRLESLTDGVFAFAMTLLVVNIELPDGFDPKTNREFLSPRRPLRHLRRLHHHLFRACQLLVARAQPDDEPETASLAYAWATLLHLLAVTFLPFSMLAVGRYDVGAAAWIYGANMILLAVTALAISRIAERDSGRARVNDGRVELAILIASALLSIVTSLFAPDYAMLPYLLNLATPVAARAVYRR